MTKKITFYSTCESKERACDNGHYTVALDFEDESVNLTGTLLLTTDGDTADSMFGLDKCYQLNIECVDDNDPYGEWPESRVNTFDPEIRAALVTIADEAENLLGLGVLGITSGLQNLKASVDKYKNLINNDAFESFEAGWDTDEPFPDCNI